jgi:hypothetical protein
MDDADRTAERVEREAPLLLKAAKKPEGPKATGNCCWCFEPLENPEARFCDEYCRDDYEHNKKRSAVNGKTIQED